MRKLKEIPLTRIREPKEIIRSLIDPEGVNELADSMKKQGQLEPIEVFKDGDEYEIIYGDRRYLAAKQLNWATIQAFVNDDIDEEQILLRKVHENLIREDLNPFDEARLVYRLVYEDGRGVHDTAKLLSKSDMWVENRMDILRWPEDVQTAIKLKQINLAVAREISKLKDNETRSRILDATISYGATAKVVKQWIDDMSVDRYFKDQAVDREMGENVAVGMSGTQMECRICGIFEDINVLRHIWLCPDCLIGIRELARETRAEMERLKHEEQK